MDPRMPAPVSRIRSGGWPGFLGAAHGPLKLNSDVWALM